MAQGGGQQGSGLSGTMLDVPGGGQMSFDALAQAAAAKNGGNVPVAHELGQLFSLFGPYMNGISGGGGGGANTSSPDTPTGSKVLPGFGGRSLDLFG